MLSIPTSLLDTACTDNEASIDTFKLAKRFGIQLLRTELPEDVIAGIVKDYGKKAVIAVSNRYAHEDQQIACAQAIAVYLKCIELLPTYQYSWTKNMDLTKTNLPKDVIDFINEFAPELMRPSQTQTKTKKMIR